MSWEFELRDGPHGGTTEGPAWDGSGLLFTNIPASRILRYDPETGASTVFRTETNNANGLIQAADGRLYACEGGARRVVRYEPDGTTTVLADGSEGQRLNIPNDLAIDPQGRVWFTDPYYEGAGGPWSRTALTRTWTTTRSTGWTSRPTAHGPSAGSPSTPRAPTAFCSRWTIGRST